MPEKENNGEAHVPEEPKPAPKPKAVSKKPSTSTKKAASAPKPVVTASTKTAAAKNGSAKTARKAAPKKAAPKPVAQAAVHRAEDSLDDFGKRLGGFLASATTKLRKVAAVAREEAEDFWAEAQSIRRGDTK